MLAYALTTVPNAIAALQTEVEPERLEPLLDAATVRIEKYCGNAFVIREHVEYHAGGVQRLYLMHSPVSSVTSVVDQGSNTITDYRIAYDLNALEYTAADCWPAAVGRWAVTFNAGQFATTQDVTPDLQLAAHLLVGEWLGDPQRPVMSTTTGTRSASYVINPVGMSERVIKILQPYLRYYA